MPKYLAWPLCLTNTIGLDWVPQEPRLNYLKNVKFQSKTSSETMLITLDKKDYSYLEEYSQKSKKFAKGCAPPKLSLPHIPYFHKKCKKQIIGYTIN